MHAQKEEEAGAAERSSKVPVEVSESCLTIASHSFHPSFDSFEAPSLVLAQSVVPATSDLNLQ